MYTTGYKMDTPQVTNEARRVEDKTVKLHFRHILRNKPKNLSLWDKSLPSTRSDTIGSGLDFQLSDLHSSSKDRHVTLVGHMPADHGFPGNRCGVWLISSDGTRAESAFKVVSPHSTQTSVWSLLHRLHSNVALWASFDLADEITQGRKKLIKQKESGC